MHHNLFCFLTFLAAFFVRSKLQTKSTLKQQDEIGENLAIVADDDGRRGIVDDDLAVNCPENGKYFD